MAPRAAVLGAGRAGRSLAAALGEAGFVVAVHGRARPLPPPVAAADLLLVATPDAAIGPVFDELARLPPTPGAVVLHLSGARAGDAADDALRASGAVVGTFHPLVPFTDAALGPERMRGAWVGVGGDATAIAAAERLAERLGARTLRVPNDAVGRARYHAAAVFASNFPVVLAAVAERLFLAAGVDAVPARGAATQLLSAAAANVANATSVGTPSVADALTGPVVRGDAATVARHLAALDPAGEAAELYRALARATVNAARAAGRLDARSAAAIEHVLG